ncbi:MAG: DotU family type IV/VI secretion system protein, partial [Planctomycetota bacterium]|nr:DotU family type IV/VI secretion system protein [Planctomycetota bacterium]
AELDDLLKDMENTASSDPDLLMQFDKVKMPLIFFTDYMIKESGLSFASEWEEVGRDYGEHAGDEKLYDMLDETLAENTPAANERIAVYYTCLGLGFTGFYTGQPEYLRRKMTEMAGRIRQMIDMDETIRICPEAYENVDTSDLIEPPGTKLTGIALAIVGLILVVFAVNITLFIESYYEMEGSLDTIISNVTSTEAQSP